MSNLPTDPASSATLPVVTGADTTVLTSSADSPPVIVDSALVAAQDATEQIVAPDVAVDAEKVATAAVGSRAEFKRLDEVWDKDAREWVLRESAPIPPPKVKVDVFGEYCFTVVRHLSRDTMQLEYTRVYLKSKTLQAICRCVIGDNEDGVHWGRHSNVDPDVLARFLPLLERHLASLKTSQTLDEQKTVQLQLLLTFIRSEYESTFAALAEETARGEITFSLIGYILLPGTLIYTTCSLTGEPVVYKLTSAGLGTSNGVMYWSLGVVNIQATGYSSSSKFGYSSNSFAISAFNGSVKISALHAFPLKFHPKEADIRAKIIERGRRWVALDGMHHMRHDGVAYGSGRMVVNSRVMIDLALYKEMSDKGSPRIIREDDDDEDEDDEDGEDDGTVRKRTNFSLLKDLTDDHLLLTPPILYGFSLSDKRWLKFNIERITAIKWNDEAFARLVLPQDQKDLVRGLVEAQVANSFEFDDYVEGKGRGLVISLWGPPGVGKTLSAEATSEHLRRPLYIVGAGDLGTTPSSLDSSLTDIFKLGAAWSAVTLIDEADVFLEQRSLHDLQRNALVAVFLRQLEYFAGLLFVTTNRVRTFDEAFQSRIHVSLHYHNLDGDARRKVWRSFLEKVGGAEMVLTGTEEDELVGYELNGRQIKNAVRTAGALAASRKEKVTFAHLNSVVKIMQQFEKDFKQAAVSASE